MAFKSLYTFVYVISSHSLIKIVELVTLISQYNDQLLIVLEV